MLLTQQSDVVLLGEGSIASILRGYDSMVYLPQDANPGLRGLSFGSSRRCMM